MIVGTHALVGLWALVLKRAGARQCQGCKPGPHKLAQLQALSWGRGSGCWGQATLGSIPKEPPWTLHVLLQGWGSQTAPNPSANVLLHGLQHLPALVDFAP